jgi:chemotaxis protein MotB
MAHKFFFTTACLVGILVAACVPAPRYMAAKSDLEKVQQDRRTAEQRAEALKHELEEAEQKQQWAESELGNCQALQANYHKELKERQAQCAYLKKINQQLLENSINLRRELKKKKSVIALQERVIRLLDDTRKTIETSLKDQIAAQQIEVVEVEDKLKVIFIDRLLFDSGSAEINPKGRKLLLMVAGTLRGSRNQSIVIEGHTDNAPLRPKLRKRFPSNWELSTARACAVARFLQTHGGVQPQRLSVRGYSYFRPVASNKTAEGRRQNRRIEIVLGNFQ